MHFFDLLQTNANVSRCFQTVKISDNKVFVDIIFHKFKLLNCSCPYLASNQCKNDTGRCGAPINIKWLHMPPYIYAQEDGVIKGILPSVMELMLKHCCGECQQLNYDQQVHSEASLITNLPGIQLSDV